MKKTIYGFMALLTFATFSCDDDDVDVTAPVITLNEPHNGDEFAAGDAIEFDALFEDNIALAQYNITVHDNFDGHSHGRKAATPFSYDQSFDVSGKVAEVHEHIDLPADATAGPYHFIVQAVDAEGNATSFANGSSKEVEIWITNEEMPMIAITDADDEPVEEIHGTVGVALPVYGVVEDMVGTLHHIEVIVGHGEEAHEHGDHSHGRRAEEEPLFEEEFEVDGVSSVNLHDLLSDQEIIILQSQLDDLEEGEHFYLTVIARDEDGNIARRMMEIHFH